MKKHILVLLATAMAVLSTACFCSLNGLQQALSFNIERGSGIVVEETRTITAVSTVEIDGFGMLHFEQGETPSLVIEAEQEYLDRLETIVVGDRLIIRPKKGWFTGLIPTKTPQIYLTLPELSELQLSGAIRASMEELNGDKITIICNGSNDLEVGSVVSDELVLKVAGAANWSIQSLEVSEFNVDISGMSNLQVEELNADLLELVISGMGNANLAGEVTVQNVRIDGSGSYNAGDLRSDDASVKVSGASSITVWAVETLSLNCDGAASVEYWGSPRVAQNNTGLAVIRSLGEKEQ